MTKSPMTDGLELPQAHNANGAIVVVIVDVDANATEGKAPNEVPPHTPTIALSLLLATCIAP
jgi:hypothetical protein